MTALEKYVSDKFYEKGVRDELNAFANATALDGRKEYDGQWRKGFEMCRQRATFAIWDLLPGGRP